MRVEMAVRDVSAPHYRADYRVKASDHMAGQNVEGLENRFGPLGPRRTERVVTLAFDLPGECAELEFRREPANRRWHPFPASSLVENEPVYDRANTARRMWKSVITRPRKKPSKRNDDAVTPAQDDLGSKPSPQTSAPSPPAQRSQ